MDKRKHCAIVSSGNGKDSRSMSKTGGSALRVALMSAIVLFIAALAASYSVFATSLPPAEPIAASPAPLADPWEKRWWIDKAARLLRGGDGLGPNDDIEHLETLPDDQIVRHFMSDERFGNTALDFNMYFLGFKVDDLKVDGEFVHGAFDFSNAITSAKQLLAGGDYLSLFDLEGDYYMAPLSVAPGEDPLPADEARLTPPQLRKKAFEELLGAVAKLQATRTANPKITIQEFCGKIEDLTEERDNWQKRLFRGFTDTEIFVFMRGGMPDFVFNGLQSALFTECEKPEAEQRFEPLHQAVAEAAAQIERSFKEVQKFEPDVYSPDTVADFRPVDHKAFPQTGKWPVFGFEQSTALANSSTNYNRKRAAYVLKRFFCDDLNPVGFDDPKAHVAGYHGTQTSCYSCHYKLDPMAGFFRNYGALFADSSSSPDIVFDDLASMNLSKYLSTWQAPKESGRTWDVGYVRSPRWTEQNSYGENLTHLSKIIRSAPEAKRCLMKRLTQYTLGEGQTVDGGYLDMLTAEFTREAETNSSAAFRNALIRVMTSRSFRVRDPDPKQCYDFAPNTRTDKRPPCRVAYILEKNCASCHDGSDILNALDLSKWIDAPAGNGKTFYHVKGSGGQLPAAKTLQEIGARLSSNDPRLRMPKNKPMPDHERQELFLWVQKELGKLESN
jgi:hypothetical protein